MRKFFRTTTFFIAGFVTAAISLVSCEKGNLAPVARLEAFPSIGDTSIIFDFDAGKSRDDRNYPPGLQYRWDFNGDGVWETHFDYHKTSSHKFNHPGAYTIIVEVKDLDGLTSMARDSIEVIGENPDIDTLTDTRDGNRYRIVKIANHWWMAENLRYGTEIPTSRDQTDNDTVDMYRQHDPAGTDSVGGVYSWFEALNYKLNNQQGICPPQWHLPTGQEWESLFKPYPDLYSIIYYGMDGLSMLNLDLNNGGFRMDGEYWWAESFSSASNKGFWSSSSKFEEMKYLPFHVGFSSRTREIVHAYWGNSGLDRYYSVRCIKDN